MNKNATINEVDSTHANASVESNAEGKKRKAKFVVTRLECRNGDEEKKEVSVVGIYDSIIRADKAMREEMVNTMCDECYIVLKEGSNAIGLAWEELGLEYWYDINVVAV